jgi:K+-sensing histidine kinase KdpD
MQRFFLLLTRSVSAKHARDVASTGSMIESIRPAVMSIAAVLLTSAVLLIVGSYSAVPHLMLGYLLPTVFTAIYFGSTVAVLTAFASALAAAYFIFPPRFSLYIADPMQVAELAFILLLAILASKAVGVLTEGTHNDKKLQ